MIVIVLNYDFMNIVRLWEILEDIHIIECVRIPMTDLLRIVFFSYFDLLWDILHIYYCFRKYYLRFVE